MKNLIDPKDISVIVQGPAERFTSEALRSIRKILPGATIILSTWSGSDIKGLDYDVLVSNQDPGSAILGGKPANYFRQIASSLNGLRVAKTTYAIKMRSDMAITHTGFLNYFSFFNTIPFAEEYRALRKRIVILPTHNPRRNFKNPFHISDWFFFGLTEDLLNIFDIPLIETDHLHSAEQYIWLSFLSKYKDVAPNETFTVPSPENIAFSEKYFANNCILASAKRIGVRSLKYPSRGYTQTPCLSDAGYYTFTEYKRMLNEYSGGHLIVIPNPFENTLYYLVYNLRIFTKSFIKTAFPRFYSLLKELANS